MLAKSPKHINCDSYRYKCKEVFSEDHRQDFCKEYDKRTSLLIPLQPLNAKEDEPGTQVDL